MSRISSRITYCKDIYYFQVFLLVPAKGLSLEHTNRMFNTKVLFVYIMYKYSLSDMLGYSHYEQCCDIGRYDINNELTITMISQCPQTGT